MARAGFAFFFSPEGGIMSNENSTPRDDVAGVTRPTANSDLILCVDPAEARLMRRAGHVHCITSVKMRRMLSGVLAGGSETALQAAVDAVKRLSGVSSADDPTNWDMWEYFTAAAPAIREAFSSVPVFQTPLRDPEDVIETETNQPWPCEGTTVLVAEDTIELVRVAITYAGFDCYRRRGRMDESFVPTPGKVCLITKDELRLIRLPDDEITVVFTYDPEETPGRVVTRWPSSLRALCGERPSLPVVISTCLLKGRRGCPFFLGLTRGVVGRNTFRNYPGTDEGALELSIETNRRQKQISREELVWEGGDDLRHLVRFGGVTVFMGNNKRRKVQLRSLGLVRAGMLAGAPIYNLTDNHNTLWAWVVSRKFDKKSAAERVLNWRRVRPSRALHEETGGTIRKRYNPPHALVQRSEGTRMRNLSVWEGGGVTTIVPLISLREGGTYYLNGRAGRDKDGAPDVIQTRCRIRCPRWSAEDAAGMLEWLGKEKCVVMAGIEPSGMVFAVVKVANGTSDQQSEAVCRWCEDAGLRFVQVSKACSFHPESLNKACPVTIGAIHHTNWRAVSLQTSQFERYQTAGDYSKPLKLERRGVATPLERARAYVEAVPLDEVGTRDTNAAGVMLNVGTKFGYDALKAVMPRILEKSTLPEKQKNKKAIRILLQTERKQTT